MESITLNPGDEIHVVVNGHTISVGHITDGSGEHALHLGGVGCNLEGEEPGLYYPAPLVRAVA